MIRLWPRKGSRRASAAKSRRRTVLRRVLRPMRKLGPTVVLAALPIGLAGWLWASGAPAKIAADADRAIGRASVSLGFIVTEVSLTGRKEAAQADVVSALALAPRQPILSFDLVAARQRIESLGWVRRAHIGRRLPSTVEVVIEERLPFALWQRQGRVALIDRTGEIITDEGLGRFTGLLVVVGRDANQHAALLIDFMASAPHLRGRVEVAVRVGGRRWTLRLDNGISVLLPEDGIASAWRRLTALQRDEKILERDISEIDLRLADRLVIGVAPELAARLREPGEQT